MTSTHGSSTPHSNSLHNSSSGADAAHSVSWGNPSGFSNNKLDGSLTTFRNAMNAIRSSMQSPVSAVNIPTSEKINPTTMVNMVNNLNGIYTRKYRYGTFEMNTVNQGTHNNSGKLTNNMNSPIASWSKHGNAGGHNVHGNTAELFVQLTPNSWTRSGYTTTKPSGKALLTERNSQWSKFLGNWIVKSTTVNKSTSQHMNGSSHSSHSSCSRKLKKEIFSFEDSALNLLRRVDIVGFKYIDDPEEIQHYGFIAEDTPSELATEFHDRMDYTNCIGILIKAVQEQQKQIEELQDLLRKSLH